MGIRFNPFTGQLYDDLSTGAQGPQGAQGPAGATGPAGPQGIQGPQGAQGADGAQGVDGTGLQIDAQVADATARNAYSASEGDQVQQADNGHVYLYKNSAWVDLGALTGAAGPQGPAGPTGPAGAQGATGPAGATGADGPQGPAGPTGPAGADGSDGATGATGPTGPTGPAGSDGATGATGPAYDGTVDYTSWSTTTGSTITWNWNTSNFWQWNPSSSGTYTFTFSNTPAAYTFAIQVLEITTNPQTITWPTIVWAQNTTPPLTQGKKTLITLSTAGGSSAIYGTFIEST